MGLIIDLLFQKPKMPEIDIPVAARLIPGIKMRINEAMDMVFRFGVWQGFVAGVLVSLLFLPSIRSQVVKGASHVLDQI